MVTKLNFSTRGIHLIESNKQFTKSSLGNYGLPVDFVPFSGKNTWNAVFYVTFPHNNKKTI